jgi:hypothetical protein
MGNDRFIFGEDERLKNTKCVDCYWRDTDPIDFAEMSSNCSVCKDRPNRNKDKSEYMKDFDGEYYKQKYNKLTKKRERKDEYDY